MFKSQLDSKNYLVVSQYLYVKAVSDFKELRFVVSQYLYLKVVTEIFSVPIIMQR